MSFNIAHLDVPADEIAEASRAQEKKRGTCEVIPAARFGVSQYGAVTFDTLVCDLRDGRSTGCAAQYCQNCVLAKDR